MKKIKIFIKDLINNNYDLAIVGSPSILALLFYINAESIYSIFVGLFIGFFIIHHERKIRELKSDSISRTSFNNVKCVDIEISIYLNNNLFDEQLTSHLNINAEEYRNILLKYENETKNNLFFNSITSNSSEIKLLIMNIPLINLNRISYTNLKRDRLGVFYINLIKFNKFIKFLIQELEINYDKDINSNIVLDHEDDSMELILSFLEERKTIYGFNISKLINLIKFYDENLYDREYHKKDIRVLNNILKKYKLKLFQPYDYVDAREVIHLGNSNFEAYVSYHIENYNPMS